MYVPATEGVFPFKQLKQPITCENHKKCSGQSDKRLTESKKSAER